MTLDPLHPLAALRWRGQVNRIPPVKYEIAGCSSCPLAHEVCVEFETQDTVWLCGHPEGKDRCVSNENEAAIETVPDFCPLVRAPLLLRVSEVAHD